MVIWRVLGAIGRTLITAGVLILLFVAYQLWGTGIQESNAQNKLENELNELFAAVEEFEVVEETAPEPEPLEVTEVAVEEAAAVGDTPAPTATPAPIKKASIPPELLYREEGEVMARILIDSINVDKNVVSGTSVDPLRLGPGHYQSTALPGQPGNASIAGHRTTYGAPFHRVDELIPGDVIKVQTIQGVAVYEVDAHEDAGGNQLGYFIVDPDATEVLQDFGDNRLTLTACHPKYSAAKRIIVTATLVSEPFDLIPRPDGAASGGASLQGDENSDVEDGAEGSELATDLILSEEVAVDADPSVTFDEDGNVVPVPEDTDPDADASGAESDAAEADASQTETAATDAEQADAGAAEQATAEADVIDRSAAEPVDEEEDFGEGLNGDRAAILPSITWALAAGFIWLAAWFIGERWRKWPMYVVAITPFALTLWLAFVHIDQALPSY